MLPNLNSDRYLYTLCQANALGYGSVSRLHKLVPEGKLRAVRIDGTIHVSQEALHELEIPVSPNSNDVTSAIERLLFTAPPLSGQQVRRLRELIGGAM